ncbi:hypothetical protein B0E54_06213 [Micromonospora sp. MH99]|nr:hypothetical protein [Micromonospora sp. MH99]
MSSKLSPSIQDFSAAGLPPPGAARGAATLVDGV